MDLTSKQIGFHNLSAQERIEIIKEFRGLREEDVHLLHSDFSSPEELELYSGKWGENVIGRFSYFPLRLAPNFLIDGKDYFIPMAIEEPSVVAAASYAALLARESGGFETDYTGSIMYGQIQLFDVENPERIMEEITTKKDELLKIANSQDQKLLSLGGGAKDMVFRPIIRTGDNHMVICHLMVDVKDVMGANAVNSMLEAISPNIEEITSSKINLRIVSNLADKRLARSKAKFPIDLLAKSGFMNGIDAVLLATGQDFRAVEAGAHSYAARTGVYTSLSACEREDEFLIIEIELPMAVGLVGGVKDPKPDLAKKILGVNGSEEFARVLASVGVAQNFGAIRALTTEGIQKGHMRLHAKQIVKQIDAGIYEERLLEELLKGQITFDRATRLLSKLRKKRIQ
jgi:hydroxymethylglutaryl-CoA reductase